MKTLLTLAAAIALAVSTPAFSAAHKTAPEMSSASMTPQQSKMADCNKEAGEKKGDDRKSFMRTCLSSAKQPPSQQEKMKKCNVDATGKKGDERKTFMKECLSA